MPLHKNLTGTELHEPKGVDAASTDEVYIADGVGSGAWAAMAAAKVPITDTGTYYTGVNVETALQEIGLIKSTYGELYINANTTAETATGSAYDTWTTGWSSGVANNINQNTGNGSLQVTAAGLYYFNAMLSFYQDAASAATWLFAAANNGTAVSKTIVSRTNSSTNIGSVSMTGLLSLSANDIITLQYNRTSGSADPIINYCNFSLVRIS